MSDDLVKRTYHRGARDFGTGYDMMARIVELEAALTKADALADQCDTVIEENIEPPYGEGGKEFQRKLAAYREARNLDA